MPRLLLTLALSALLFTTAGRAQDTDSAAPCGIVAELRDPLAPLSLRYDDFGIYRARFGGQHVGLDMGFGEDAVGRPVFAVARGQVTYADPHGWDTEGGVIVLAHHFPDGSVAHSLYGHIQPEGDTFPAVGLCVEAGTVLAHISTPTLSAPHLHFEFRDFLPADGGPGYVPGNPLEAGWFHPLDFAAAWRVRLKVPARATYSSPQAPSLPPVLLADGQLILASGNTVLALSRGNELRWRLQSATPLQSLLALPDGRIVASTHVGQVLVVQDGRYRAIWSPAVALAGLAPIALGETLIFAAEDGTLAAHSPMGELRWLTEAGGKGRALALSASGSTIALLLEKAGVRLQLYAAADGRFLGEWPFAALPSHAARPNDGGWWLFDGTALFLLSQAGGEWRLGALATVGRAQAPDRAAQLHALADGGALLFTGSAEGRLIAFAPAGEQRWEQSHPALAQRNPPLLASAADGCWLAALAEDGTLLFLSGEDGAALGEGPGAGTLYPGGQRQRQPAARLLERRGETILVGAGFLSVLALEPAAVAELSCGGGG